MHKKIKFRDFIILVCKFNQFRKSRKSDTKRHKITAKIFEKRLAFFLEMC